MLPFEYALEQILTSLPAPSSRMGECLPLQHAKDRICSENIISPINIPVFDNAAMDGYAVRLADLEQSLTLPIAGKSFAGKPFSGEWPPQTVIRIMTGAMLPEGTDAVVMQEDVVLHENDSVTFSVLPKTHQNIRHIGEDVKQGDIVLKTGSKLTALSLPLLASLGITQVKVFPRLKVAVLSTGDELATIGEVLRPGQIYDSNRFAVKLMLEKLNCEVLDFGILPDDPTQFEEAFMTAQQQADLVITSGGVSVGEADFTKTVLEKIGQVNFWKLAIKPGKPFAFGKLENAWFCGLPGNPVSALVTFYQLVRPAIAKLSGENYQPPQQLRAIAATEIKKTVGRLDFQRGYYQLNQQGQLEVRPVGFQGSHLFASFIHSNCFIVLERERGHIQQGETVIIEPFTHLLD